MIGSDFVARCVGLLGMLAAGVSCHGMPSSAAPASASASPALAPSMPTSTPPHLALRTTTAFPAPIHPPALVVAVERRVHVVAPSASARRATHLVLDESGGVVLPAHELELSPVAAAACGGELVVLGVADGDKRFALGVDERGAVRWQTALPIASSGLVWLGAACSDGELRIVWDAEVPGGGEVAVAAVRSGTLGAPAVFARPRSALGFDVAALGRASFVLRWRGASGPAELLRIDADGVTAQATTTNPRAIAAVGDRLALLSWTPEALLLEWRGAGLEAIGPPQVVASVTPPSWMRHATLHVEDVDRFAIGYLISSLDESAKGEHSEAAEAVRYRLGRHDHRSGTLADVTELSPAATDFGAGAWLGDCLLVVHGARGASLSVFELAPRGPASTSR